MSQVRARERRRRVELYVGAEAGEPPRERRGRERRVVECDDDAHAVVPVLSDARSRASGALRQRLLDDVARGAIQRSGGRPSNGDGSEKRSEKRQASHRRRCLANLARVRLRGSQALEHDPHGPAEGLALRGRRKAPRTGRRPTLHTLDLSPEPCVSDAPHARDPAILDDGVRVGAHRDELEREGTPGRRVLGSRLEAAHDQRRRRDLDLIWVETGPAGRSEIDRRVRASGSPVLDRRRSPNCDDEEGEALRVPSSAVVILTVSRHFDTRRE